MGCEIGGFSSEVMRLMPNLIREIHKKGAFSKDEGAITVSQYIALNLLFDSEASLKMKDIANELHVTLPAVTGLVERLHAIGTIKRIHDSGDRRVVYIKLTDKGRRIMERFRKTRRETIEKLFSKLSDSERSTYLNILRKLIRIVQGEKGAA